MYQFIIAYLVIINLIGFFIMGNDKKRAKKGSWRIPEKTLFTIALLFGSIGVSVGMKQFHHKTKHKSFVYGIPAIEIAQLILILVLIYLFQFKI